jgi:hypothetical protein
MPIIGFLILALTMIILLAVDRPTQTLIGALVVAIGGLVSWHVVRRSRCAPAATPTLSPAS